MSELRDILARTLAAQGALVEPLDPDGLEICAPPHLQSALALPEWSRVGFGATLPEQAARVSFEAEWAQRLMRLLGERGSYLSFRWLSDVPPAPAGELERDLSRSLVLDNATFRVAEFTPARSNYFLLVYHVTSTSDDKREDTICLCINESNGAVSDRLVSPLIAKLREEYESRITAPFQAELPLGMLAPKLGERANRLLPSRIRIRLAPFLAGMERRMARDLDRLHTYYGDLRAEASIRIENRKRKGEEPKTIEAEQMRLQAIEREYHAKVADLDRKYAMSVDVRLAQVVRAQLPAWRAELFLMRRKGIRKICLDWCALSKEFDLLPCEACFATPRTFRVCDDRLHLTCSACISCCPDCGKEFCRACHPVKCPKCGRPWEDR